MKGDTTGVALVIHSGGPTSVINASLLGVVEEARQHAMITAIYGARFGIAGVLREDLLNIGAESPADLEAVARTPGSALGTSRREVSPSDLDQFLKVLRKHAVRFLFYTGGNGSMGTASQIQKLAASQDRGLQVIGIPKTIDNDLMGTDHTPGYGSAARFFANAVRDIGMDNEALSGQVEVIEVLGRNTGWIAAATTLARSTPDDAPHLVYLPETPLPLDLLLDDAHRVYNRLGHCVVVVCEGQLDSNGRPFGADVRSGSRGSLAMNLGHRLAMLISERLKLRARSEKPGLLGRSSSWSVSQSDWDEARLCGRHAVLAAINGRGGSMVTLVRNINPYSAGTGLVDLDQVAFVERRFPSEWRNAAGNDILPPFREYASPLVGPIPSCPRLAKIPV